MTKRSRMPALLAAAALAAVGLAACGDDEDSSSSAPATSPAATSSSTAASGGGAAITVEADPNGDLAFTKTKLSGPAGSDTIDFENASSTPHNVEIEDSGGEVVAETDTISGSSTSTTADLQPGTYTFFCDVPGHREAGMEGTLTIK